MSHRVTSVTQLYELVSQGRIGKAEAVRLARQLQGAGQAQKAEQPQEAEQAGPAVPSGVDPEVLRDRVCDVLADKVRQLLKVSADDLDVDVDLSEYGLDSVIITQLASMVNDALGVDIKPTTMFDHPNLRALAAHIADEHGSGLAARLGLRPATVPVAREEASPVVPSPVSEPVAPARPAPAPAALPRQAPAAEDRGTDAIAIIGVSCRFPQADDLDAFWHNLHEGRDCISEVPADRWDWRELYGDPFAEEGRTTVKWGGFVDGVADFDPEFFGIAPREARLMDPQHRLLMLHVWKALEDAGYAASSLAGSDLGIIVGTAGTGYHRLIEQHARGGDGVAATATVPSIGPNRMSFFLDVHGPSEPVETACSSSLVALHRAVTALERGECSMAVAGGVNTVPVPDGHISFGRAGMLSDDGRCKSFSDRADGYSRGEGVGMLVLKKLSAAERDGDHIHGVIRATAVNHGGRANSLTAPNPRAQAAVILDAHRRAGVDPRTIGYVEAHGTGTKLGDPVEVNGLRDAFRQLYADFGTEVGGTHCGIGTVKTNIGHLELSAGIAGVIKVLLQMRHRTLVESLHCETVNPYVDLDGSPFFLVRERQHWPAPLDADGRELPRRAGVSSFGFGGANAHVVIEEYRAPAATTTANAAQGPFAIVLSAREPGTLVARARQLLSWLDDRTPSDVDLAGLAYTLQVGRVAMPERLAFTARTVEDLREVLSAFVAGELPGHVHRGSPQPNGLWKVLAADEDIAAAMDTWVAKGKLSRLLELWAGGFDFDWRRLYGDTPPRRVPLPSYPFNLRRFWIADGASRAATAPHGPHVLSGNEFYVRDHLVRGVPVLPAVAYLELAREAFTSGAAVTGLRLRDVCWLRPIEVTGSCGVEVSLSPPHGSGAREFAVRVAGAEAVHAQGVGHLDEALARTTETIDVRRLLDTCARGMDSGEFYRLYERLGMSYGPALRAVRSLHVGDGVAVARLTVPREAESPLVLNPSVLDGAFQAVLGAWSGEDPGAEGRLALPFAVREVQVRAATPADGWVVVRGGAEDRGGDVHRFDIDVCDADGLVCVRMLGFSIKALPAPALPAEARTCLMAPVWDAVRVDPVPAWPAEQARVVLFGGDAAERAAFRELRPRVVVLDPESTVEELTSALPADAEHVVVLDPVAAGTAFRLVKAVQASGGDGREIGWTVITRQARLLPGDEVVNPAGAGAHGLFGSLARECPQWPVRVVDVPAGEPVPWNEVLELAPQPGGALLARRDGEWYRQGLLELTEPVPAGPVHENLRPDDVVVAVGGAGGIGVVWTEHLIRRYKARVVWIGRRPLDDRIEELRHRLSAHGPAPDYIQADATDPAALRRARDEVVRRYGPVRGVLHSTIVLGDQSLARMDEERFGATYAAKAEVAVNIAEVFADEPLDFVVFFSSLQSFLTSPGQANYAAGCTFADAYAEHLRTRLSCPVKVVNWGYWGGVGVAADDAHRERMAKGGVGSIEPAEGMAAYDTLMGGRRSQLALIKVTNTRALDGLLGDDVVEHVAPVSPELAGVLRDSRARGGEHTGALDAELVKVTWAVLRSLGLFEEDGPRDAVQWRESGGITEQHDHWLRHTLDLLADAGFLVRDRDGRYRRAEGAPEDVGEIWAEWDRQRDTWPDDEPTSARVLLADTALRALGEVLTGRRPATGEVLDPVTEQVTGVLAESLADYVRHRLADDPTTELRVLEIGGAGDTALRGLEPWRDHLDTCRRTVSDIEKPPAGQHVETGTFDVVIAAGLRSAAQDVRVALRHTKAALRANGILLLTEEVSGGLLSHLTSGLLPRRPGAEVPTADGWRRLLLEAGFRGAFTAAESAVGQQVFVAESDGAIRRPRAAAVPVEAPRSVPAERDTAPGTVAERVTALLADVLDLDPAELELDVPLRRHGFDSIFMAQFLSQLKKHVDDTLSLDVIAECETLRDVLDAVGATAAPVVEVQDHPELIQMNRGREGRPVFWIHHGNGGVESYRPLADRSGRPFYGIQPRGWAGSGEILGGQVPMARHYASLIRAVQPEGPYDIGGFSLGGLLAYEVVRQLQLQGAQVNTLVMLDSLDAPATNQVNAIMQGGRTEPDAVAKVSAFRAVNLVLGNNRLDAGSGTTPILHRDDVDPGLPYPEFFDSLIAAALAAGITKTEAQLRKQVTQLARYFEVMQGEHYVTSRLPRPDSVSCYYFRNRSGRFFGDFRDYMVLFDNPELPGLDGVEYWRDWERQIDDFSVTVVDTDSHADVMTAPQSLEKVLRLCDEIYAHGVEAARPATQS
ncbi:polyketide synthase PksN/rhizoxin biosynthesis, polyketide synthase RhiD [Lentzea xinjiangensis]|uniref:Polyketide synthase PksN/rhizoxin biosynthesis, polyketide synthase RhiD n=1 Tax=Lentzea xinjiangensis TaxID=402600 RepID=A0A1H9WHI2_9PSEU|nr:SDR family NAD(P)-dependent oxidoreductase [Lentzea xinjiangensis]SES33281.1 polyketide synthase PksN/rhizoxin biosynthesis, polyketide synthase RhiD [Lentzea xinjiangensis]